MKKVKMIALCACPYGVGVVPKGQLFDADERDVKLLRALKRARIAEGEPEGSAGPSLHDAAGVDPTPPTLSSADGDTVGAAGTEHQKPPIETAESGEQPKGRRTYRRQDMRADK